MAIGSSKVRVRPSFGNSADKFRHASSDACSAEQGLLNKQHVQLVCTVTQVFGDY